MKRLIIGIDIEFLFKVYNSDLYFNTNILSYEILKRDLNFDIDNIKLDRSIIKILNILLSYSRKYKNGDYINYYKVYNDFEGFIENHYVYNIGMFFDYFFKDIENYYRYYNNDFFEIEVIIDDLNFYIPKIYHNVIDIYEDDILIFSKDLYNKNIDKFLEKGFYDFITFDSCSSFNLFSSIYVKDYAYSYIKNRYLKSFTAINFDYLNVLKFGLNDGFKIGDFLKFIYHDNNNFKYYCKTDERGLKYSFKLDFLPMSSDEYEDFYRNIGLVFDCKKFIDTNEKYRKYYVTPQENLTFLELDFKYNFVLIDFYNIIDECLEKI